MNPEANMIVEKCSGCGQPIPANEYSCPNCGRKRKTPIPVGVQAKTPKPVVAQYCTALAWVALIIGLLALVAGIDDSMRMHPSSTGEFATGIALLFSAMFCFVAARAITLLAEIAHNTRPK